MRVRDVRPVARNSACARANAISFWFNNRCHRYGTHGFDGVDVNAAQFNGDVAASSNRFAFALAAAAASA